MKTYLLSFILVFFSHFSMGKGYPPHLGVSYNQTPVFKLTPPHQFYENGILLPADSIPLLLIFRGDSIRLSASGGYEGVDKFQISRYDSLIYENNVSTVNMYIAKFHYVSDTGSFTFYADNDVSYSVIHFKVKYIDLFIDKIPISFFTRQISVFPNPTSHYLTITASDTLLNKDIEISIYDLNSNQIINLSYKSEFIRDEITIPLNNLPNGEYVLIFQTDYFVEKRKIIKSN